MRHLAFACIALLASCAFESGGLNSGATSTTSGSTGGSSTSSSTSSMASTTSTGVGGMDVSSSSTSGTGGQMPVCGDGVVGPGEQCDDGNKTDGDGCSATCTIESTDGCPAHPVALGASTVVIHGSLQGKSDHLAPSCGGSAPDVVYAVTPTVSGTLTALLTGLGSQVLAVRSRCEDGPTSDLWCGVDTSSGTLSTSLWVHAGVTVYVVVEGQPSSGQPPSYVLTLALSACGDGVKQGLEECDDPTDSTCVGCVECNGPGETLDPQSGHCYLYGTGKGWNAARAACVAWGGDLVGIHAQNEFDFLTTKVATQDTIVWTGGNDMAQDCSFAWANGERWWPLFPSDQPNGGTAQNCIALDPEYGLEMNDQPCGDTHDYICERAPAGHCGDGIVQPGEECDDTGPNCVACKVTCNAGEFEDPATQHCYFLSSDQKSWDSASSTCNGAGAYLAVITSAAEESVIHAQVKSDTWFGGKVDLSGNLSWVDTDGAYGGCYTNWRSGEPNNLVMEHCAEIYGDGTWNNQSCGDSRTYVCERDPAP